MSQYFIRIVFSFVTTVSHPEARSRAVIRTISMQWFTPPPRRIVSIPRPGLAWRRVRNQNDTLPPKEPGYIDMSR